MLGIARRRHEMHGVGQEHSEVGIPVDPGYPVGHVRRYGATGNGIADDTAAFAQAANAIRTAGKGRVIVDDGTYLIDADVDGGRGIQLPSNCVLEMSSGATLRAKPNSLARYGIVCLNDVNNTHVIGGHIEGERGAHRGTAGEWGMGIWMNSARNCSVRGTTISDCWGDAVCICSVEPKSGTECQDIVLDSIKCDNNRRQGVSVVAARRVSILNSFFTRTSGTAPSAGIDFEPDVGSAVVEDCLVQNCTFGDNAIGVQVVGASRGVRVLKNRFRANRAVAVSLVRTGRESRVEDNTIAPADAASIGIHLEGSSGARVVNNTLRGTFRFDVREHESHGNDIARNVVIKGD